MSERGLVFRLGRFAVYREINAIDKILYIAKPIRISEYRFVRMVGCEIRRLPWFRGAYSIICDVVESTDHDGQSQ